MRFAKTLLLLAALLAPASIASAQQEVDIQLESFGVESFFRPGDFTGIRLRLVSNLREPVNTQVVWEVPEGLGDIAEHTRIPVALTPGVPTNTWLYAKLLPDISLETVWTVRVYRDDDGERGEELGSIKISPRTAQIPPQPVGTAEALFGVIGNAGPHSMGLDDYNVTRSGSRATPITAHEFTVVAPGINAGSLPDRWEGLDSFSFLVWTTDTPSALSTASGRALRDWVQRGGHLAIVLSPSSNDWNLGSIANSPIHDLLPQTLPPTRVVTLREILPVLSKRKPQSIPDDKNGDLRVRVFDTIDNGYEPLLAMEDGRVVGVQRLYGFGRISVIGVELHSGQYTQQSLRLAGGGVIEGDALWNRILGRRVDTLRGLQFRTLEDSDELARDFRREADIGPGELIVDYTNLQGQAFAGIGLAFVLFAAYWVLAGPVGYGILRSMKKVKHAWVVFALTSAAFTGIAWVGVKVFSQKHVEAQHITFLDCIVDNPASAVDPTPGDMPRYRASSWFTIFLPGYGERELTLESPPGERNILAPFSAPGVPQTRFRNVDRYVVRLSQPHSYEVPVRATTKDMYARWTGDLDEDWGGMFEPITGITEQGDLLTGEVGHNFPGTLRNVKIIHVQSRPTQRKTYRSDLGAGIDPHLSTGRTKPPPLVGRVYELAQWGPDETVQLDRLGAPAPASTDFDNLADQLGQFASSTGMAGGMNESQRRLALEGLSFYHMLEPPTYIDAGQQGFNTQPDPIFKRHLAREVDLSEWFARPCVIIYGLLENSRLPVPLTVSGGRVQGDGLTVVRWIYPLPLDRETVTP